MSFWKKHTDKVGVIGLGFLINDAVLVPLLIVFLLLTLIGLYLGMRQHHDAPAFILGIISAISLFVFIFVSFHKTLAAISVAGLVMASALNVLLRQSG
jgi:mercuric ion transport protein